MKNIFIVVLCLFLAGTSIAQNIKGDIEKAEDLSKAAKKALVNFHLDQEGNRAKLLEAQTKIDEATALVNYLNLDHFKGPFSKQKDLTKSKKKLTAIYLQRGEIYDDISTLIVGLTQLGTLTEELTNIAEPAISSAKAYENALQFTNKKYQVKDAVSGLQSIQSNLNNIALFAFEDKNYPKAYRNFVQGLKVHDILKEKKASSRLDEPKAYNDQMYYAALAALNGKMEKDAAGLFEKLYTANYDNSLIYDGLYRINSADGDLEGAYKYLEAGRKKYPEDVSLLFAEINHFLRLNKLDQLIDKLKTAIAAEPENISLYSTLGNVYDNLYQRESEEGNKEKAQEYFDAAYDSYNQALKKDSKYFDAIYSIGALYYNKAAVITKEIQGLGTSKEELKMYEKLKSEMFGEFEKALPYFQRCEKINPSDVNTLMALREIFARKDDLETTTEFKKRLEKVKAGETILESYFN